MIKLYLNNFDIIGILGGKSQKNLDNCIYRRRKVEHTVSLKQINCLKLQEKGNYVKCLTSAYLA